MKYIFQFLILWLAIPVTSCHTAKQSSLEKAKLHKPDLPVRVLFKNSDPEIEQAFLNCLRREQIELLSEKEALALTSSNFDAALHSIKDIKSISSKSEMESAMRAGLKSAFYVLSINPEFQNDTHKIVKIKWRLARLSNQYMPSSPPPYQEYNPTDSTINNEAKILAFTQFLLQSKAFR